MPLPISVCPVEEVELPSGVTLKIRGLSRAEALLCRKLMPDEAAVERRSIEFSTSSAEGEVEAWYATARNDDVAALIDHIARLSGLNTIEGKDDAEG